MKLFLLCFCFCCSYQTIEDLTVQADFLQTQLSEIQKRLSDWNNPEKIDSLELLEQMEDYIAGVLDQIQTQKANIGKQQFLALERNYQLQNAMHVPFSLGAEQQLQHFSCVQNDDSRHMVSLMETNLPPKREMELSSGNSFGNYYGYFGTVEKAEIACTGQGSGILSDLLRTEFLRNELIGLQTETLRNELTKTEYLENEVRKTESLRIELMKSDFLTHELIKNECLRNELIKAESSRNELMKSESLTDEVIRTESLRNEMKTQSLRNELSKTGSLRNEFVEAESFRLQLCEPYSYPQCDFTTLSDKKFQPSQQTNLQTSIEDYRAEGHFEQPQSGYVSNHCNWASTSGPFADATFDEQLYPQQQYSAGGHVTEELGPLDVETTHQHSLINLGPLDVEATHQPSLTH
ncbi:hypothetical protein U1Q18_016856 [Sarracenia purpurea var. burkii]